MNPTPFILAFMGLALSACSPQPVAVASAKTVVPSLKSGEQVYQNVCIACHAVGVANAPKFGDAESWHELKAEGQPAVTAHGWVGLRGMPARGGQADLTLEEFARAVAWMARNSGVVWQDPDVEMLDKIREEETKRIEQLGKTSKTGDTSYNP